MRNRYKSNDGYWDSCLTAMFFIGMAAFWVIFFVALFGQVFSPMTEVLK